MSASTSPAYLPRQPSLFPAAILPNGTLQNLLLGCWVVYIARVLHAAFHTISRGSQPCVARSLLAQLESGICTQADSGYHHFTQGMAQRCLLCRVANGHDRAGSCTEDLAGAKKGLTRAHVLFPAMKRSHCSILHKSSATGQVIWWPGPAVDATVSVPAIG